MILIAGESLIDLIVDADGKVNASPGGGAFNAARTIARLGVPARFLGRFSGDPFGQLLAAQMAQSGVFVARPEPVTEPTALAVVSLSGAGIAQYWFHLTGAAAFLLDQQSAAEALASGQVMALHIGTLGLVVEPMATGMEQLAAQLPDTALLFLDPNCRPSATPDADAYRARVQRLLTRTDILKVSTEDLAFLLPGQPVPAAVQALLGAGARCVLVTDGPAVIRACIASGGQDVPVPPVEVVDTVGAGDAFGGGFLAWWAEHGLRRDDLADPGLLRAAVAAGAAVASLTCGKAGADPPWRHELGRAEGWDPVQVVDT
ncbi:MAG: PfkB family carbohydrate kinase [Actinomycetota bacterium]